MTGQKERRSLRFPPILMSYVSSYGMDYGLFPSNTRQYSAPFLPQLGVPSPIILDGERIIDSHRVTLYSNINWGGGGEGKIGYATG
jgi:hypothetical protein